MQSVSNKIIIAAAGAGKTTKLVDFALSLNANKILITTFTDNNTSEIQKKIISIKKCVPSNIIVMPWFSFLLKEWIRPFQSAIYEGEIKGMLLVNHQSTQGIKEENIEYYLTPDKKIYSDKIAKFGKRCNDKSHGAVLERLSAIYNYILVDELQDITGEDLDILKIILQSNISTLFVGDPRQSTLISNPSRKNKKYKSQHQLSYFDKFVEGTNCIIDGTSMNICFRCNEEICTLANKLYPKMPQVVSGNNEHKEFEGLYLVRPSDIESFIRQLNAIQLRNSVNDLRTIKEYPVMNFGASKGLTMDSVLIFPTEPMTKWFEGTDNLANISRCRLYIAITRAKYCIGVVYNYKNNTNIEGFKNYTP